MSICSIEWDLGSHAFSNPDSNNNSWYTYATSTARFEVGIPLNGGGCYIRTAWYLGPIVKYSGTLIEVGHYRPNGGCAVYVKYRRYDGSISTSGTNVGCQYLFPGDTYPAPKTPCHYVEYPGNNYKLVAIDDGIETTYDINDPNSVTEIPCAACGENELDCGDCCLPCIDVFNNISEIRQLLLRIR